MANKTNNTYFVVDFFKKKIIGTKTSFNKAGKGISPYYQQLTTLIKEHPKKKKKKKEPKKKSNKPKRDYNGMDFEFMEKYIAIQKNSVILLREYQSVKAYAKSIGKSTYPTVKKWFLGEFAPDGEGFDMAMAKKEISQVGIFDAVEKAHESTETDSAELEAEA